MKKYTFRVSELSEKLARGEITSAELTEDCIHRIKTSPFGDRFAFLDVDGAMQAARASDERRARGCALGALDGIPFAAEDRFCTVRMPTENNCEMLRGYQPLYDADAVRRLKDSGAVLIGKLQTKGFLSADCGPTSERSRLVGDDGLLPFALIAETGGASWICGKSQEIVICPARDVISRQGLIACAPSFDRVGILVGSFDDGKYMMERLLERIGSAVAPESVKTVWWGEGGSVDLPISEKTQTAYRILSAVEAASEMGLYDGIRFGVSAEGDGTARGQMAETRGRFFSREEQKLLLLGTVLLKGEHREKHYLAALKLREAFQRQLEEVFSRFDLLVCPVSEKTACLPAFADLSVVSRNGTLWMAPRGREDMLLICAERWEK